jgi:hypothetical protein
LLWCASESFFIEAIFEYITFDVHCITDIKWW